MKTKYIFNIAQFVLEKVGQNRHIHNMQTYASSFPLLQKMYVLIIQDLILQKPFHQCLYW